MTSARRGARIGAWNCRRTTSPPPGCAGALTAARGKRGALEQEWAAQQRALHRRRQDLLGRVEALTAQHAALAAERPGGTRPLPQPS